MENLDYVKKYLKSLKIKLKPLIKIYKNKYQVL